MNHLSRLSIHSALIAGAAIVIVGCASSGKMYNYPATTNAGEEIQALDGRMSTARDQHVPVYSPVNFDRAEKHLRAAKEQQAKGKPNSEVLEHVGMARTAFDDATRVSNEVKSGLADVVKARDEAVAAKAHTVYEKDFRSADNTFRDYTRDFEEGDTSVSLDDRAKLQRRFLDLELRAIKHTQLGEAKSLIDAAVENDAKKLAPQSLTDTMAKYNNAEAVINTDRHNSGAFQPAVTAATIAARKLNQTVTIVKNAKGKSPEAIALAIQKAGETIDSQSAALSSASADSARKDAVIGGLATQNRRLSKIERLDRSLELARQRFSKGEADVYRQGDQLLIRFKQIQFSSGRKELPAASIATLAKAKEVISGLEAEKVMVEGHTDSVGGQTKNQRLSEERADAIAQYLVAEDVVKKDQIEAKGFGFTKPLATNKTKDGRAQNRRVDLLITPMGARESGVAE